MVKIIVKGWFKRFYDDVMAWHVPKESEENINDVERIKNETQSNKS